VKKFGWAYKLDPVGTRCSASVLGLPSQTRRSASLPLKLFTASWLWGVGDYLSAESTPETRLWISEELRETPVCVFASSPLSRAWVGGTEVYRVFREAKISSLGDLRHPELRSRQQRG